MQLSYSSYSSQTTRPWLRFGCSRPPKIGGTGPDFAKSLRLSGLAPILSLSNPFPIAITAVSGSMTIFYPFPPQLLRASVEALVPHRLSLHKRKTPNQIHTYNLHEAFPPQSVVQHSSTQIDSQVLRSINLSTEYINFIANALPSSQPMPAMSSTVPIKSKSPPRTSRFAKHTNRSIIFIGSITIFGYPSRGGVIVLEYADAIDFDFLNLSRLDPPSTRASTPEAEDEFCQRLLLLGAKWFDSESRYRFMAGVREGEYYSIRDLESGKRPELILGERRWIKVG